MNSNCQYFKTMAPSYVEQYLQTVGGLPRSSKEALRDTSMNSLNRGGCRLRMRLRSHDRFRSQRKFSGKLCKCYTLTRYFEHPTGLDFGLWLYYVCTFLQESDVNTKTRSEQHFAVNTVELQTAGTRSSGQPV